MKANPLCRNRVSQHASTTFENNLLEGKVYERESLSKLMYYHNSLVIQIQQSGADAVGVFVNAFFWVDKIEEYIKEYQRNIN